MSVRNIEDVIRVINNHIKEYEKREYPVDKLYEEGVVDGSIDALIDLRDDILERAR